MSQKLYLGSQSASRQKLLREARIPFEVVTQRADEAKCDWGLEWQKLLESIAVHKMAHVVLPDYAQEQGACFVLTADTMCVDSDGRVHGKPVDRQDAIKKIQALRRGGRVGTAFCLDKKIYKSGNWCTEDRVQEFVGSGFVVDMPDAWIEKYLAVTPHYLDVSGAITIEGFGAQFVKLIDGSYTTILGLPMFQLRVALEQLGFLV